MKTGGNIYVSGALFFFIFNLFCTGVILVPILWDWINNGYTPGYGWAICGGVVLHLLLKFGTILNICFAIDERKRRIKEWESQKQKRFFK